MIVNLILSVKKIYLLHLIQCVNLVSISSSEPDSPPVNLTVVDTSASTATLAWSAPERANGVIQQYVVLYENESHSALMNSSVNGVTLMNLRPFTHYNVSVMAYTRYGHGNQTSETLLLLSGEDGVLMGAVATEIHNSENNINISKAASSCVDSHSSPGQSSAGPHL